jgi:signal peptidase I
MEEGKLGNSVQKILISLLKEGKEVWVGTDGRSMYPLIKEGDFVKIKPVKVEELLLGDIVAFHHNGEKEVIIAHRLIKKNKDVLLTRGDNSFLKYADAPVDQDDFLGKIVARKRNGQTRALDRGFFKYYGEFTYYLSRYGYPLLIFWLIAKKLVGERHLIIPQALKRMRQLINA